MMDWALFQSVLESQDLNSVLEVLNSHLSEAMQHKSDTSEEVTELKTVKAYVLLCAHNYKELGECLHDLRKQVNIQYTNMFKAASDKTQPCNIKTSVPFFIPLLIAYAPSFSGQILDSVDKLYTLFRNCAKLVARFTEEAKLAATKKSVSDACSKKSPDAKDDNADLQEIKQNGVHKNEGSDAESYLNNQHAESSTNYDPAIERKIWIEHKFEVCCLLVCLFIKLGHYKEAVVLLQRNFVERNEKSAEACSFIAFIYSERLGNVTVAKHFFDMAGFNYPSDGKIAVKINSSYLAFKQGLFGKAVDGYTEVVNLMRNHDSEKLVSEHMSSKRLKIERNNLAVARIHNNSLYDATIELEEINTGQHQGVPMCTTSIQNLISLHTFYAVKKVVNDLPLWIPESSTIALINK